MNTLKMAAGGARMALAFIEQGFAFASMEAEKLGRVDVKTNIDEAKNALSGLADVLVQIPVGGRDFLQWMGDAAAGLTNFAHLIGALGIQMQLNMGLINQETAEMQLSAMLTDKTAQKTKALADDKQAAASATQSHADAEKRLQEVMKNVEGYKSSQKAADDAKASLGDLRRELEKLQRENGQAAYTERDVIDARLDVNQATIDELQAARDLWNAQQDLNTAQADGKTVTEEMNWKVEEARIRWERSKLALDDARTALENAKTATIDNSVAIAELQIKLQDETTAFENATREGLAYAAALGKVKAAGDELGTFELNARLAGTPARRQTGGEFVAGGAYIINESPATAPETIVVNPSGQGGQVLTRQQVASVGSQTINVGPVNLYNDMDLAQFQAMLRQTLRP
jgi:DNA repair exonuclease SbcCD ATPase subunit